MSHPKFLVVEGKHERFTIPEIIEKAGVPWVKPWPVHLHDADGIGNILGAGIIEAWVKAPGRQAVGIVVDADADPAARWQSLVDHCAAFITLPSTPGPVAETITIAGRQVAFGVWMMPDCTRAGMFEDLLIPLFRPAAAPLHQHVVGFVDQGKALGAGFKADHRSKAILASWIALEEPGQAAWRHDVLGKMVLDDASLSGFVTWFRTLFSV